MLKNDNLNKKYLDIYKTNKISLNDLPNLDNEKFLENHKKNTKMQDKFNIIPDKKYFSNNKFDRNDSLKRKTWEENILSNTYSQLFINTYLTRKRNQTPSELNPNLNQKLLNESPEKFSPVKNSKNLASRKIKGDNSFNIQNLDNKQKFNSSNENILTLSNASVLNIAYESQRSKNNLSLLQLEKEINQIKSLELSFKNVNDISLKLPHFLLKKDDISGPILNDLEEPEVHNLTNKNYQSVLEKSIGKQLDFFHNPKLESKIMNNEEIHHNIPKEIIKTIHKVTVGKGYFYY